MRRESGMMPTHNCVPRTLRLPAVTVRTTVRALVGTPVMILVMATMVMKVAVMVPVTMAQEVAVVAVCTAR
jgi:hypothetical protein